MVLLVPTGELLSDRRPHHAAVLDECPYPIASPVGCHRLPGRVRLEHSANTFDPLAGFLDRETGQLIDLEVGAGVCGRSVAGLQAFTPGVVVHVSRRPRT